MINKWKGRLRVDPLPALLDRGEPALTWFVHKDLLYESIPPVEASWELPEASKLVQKQQPDGSWKYPGKAVDLASGTNYNLLETYRALRLLVEKYRFNRLHPAIQKAAGYAFSCQTDEGDIRGILGNQYMPYYHGVILELLIKAGYAEDPRTRKGLDWLLSMRQDDGGWLIPVQLVPHDQKTAQLWHGTPVEPDRRRPHAHLATGMALRAFADHKDYANRPEVLTAGERLKERLFQADRYYDRKASAYWLKFQFPFWWTSLVTALDSLSRLDFDPDDKQIARGLEWFTNNQSADGLWETGYGCGREAVVNRAWSGLSICRILIRFTKEV